MSDEEEEWSQEVDVVNAANFDKRLVAVSKVIKDVEPPGDFFTSGKRKTFPMPSLVVDDLGDLPLPLVDTIAKALIAKCRLAPYGLGEQTLVDPLVRNTWELSPSQFHIENSEWQPFVDEILESCRASLGIPLVTCMEAKLYKMLLYEPGGKFEKHQDSEKEDGMFGTLVVVLPCRFEGGELEVHDPSTGSHELNMNKRVWDPANADVSEVKYAAFYGDCPHEVKPIMKGHRLCLTYNLLIRSDSNRTTEVVPHFTGSSPHYDALKSSLCEFFRNPAFRSPKRAKTSKDGEHSGENFDLTDPATHRLTKFIYILNHKYTQSFVKLQHLKNKDALVAESLAQVCRESHGALELYMCPVTYKFEWCGIEGTTYHSDDEEDLQSIRMRSLLSMISGGRDFSPTITRELKLGSELVSYWRGEKPEYLIPEDVDHWEGHVIGNLETEVAPVGFFDRKLIMDGEKRNMYTGNEGSSVERWYNTTALVVLPLALRYKFSFKADPIDALASWVALAGKNYYHAQVAAEGFVDHPNDWSLKGSEYFVSTESGLNDAEALLIAVKKLNKLDVVRVVLASCKFVEFQPMLRDLVVSFDWVDVVSMVKELAVQWKGKITSLTRSLVNLVASLLGGETDKAKIESLLTAVSLNDDSASLTYQGEFCDVTTRPEEYVRVLSLAWLASADFLKKFLEATVTTRVLVVAPAVQLLVLSRGDACPDELRRVVQLVIDQVEAGMPELRQLLYRHLGMTCPDYDQRARSWGRERECESCNQLKAFLAANEMQMEVTGLKDVDHARKLFDKLGWEKMVSVESKDTDENESKIVIRKTHESKLYCMAIEMKQTLNTLLN